MNCFSSNPSPPPLPRNLSKNSSICWYQRWKFTKKVHDSTVYILLCTYSHSFHAIYSYLHSSNYLTAKILPIHLAIRFNVAIYTYLHRYKLPLSLCVELDLLHIWTVGIGTRVCITTGLGRRCDQTKINTRQLCR